MAYVQDTVSHVEVLWAHDIAAQSAPRGRMHFILQNWVEAKQRVRHVCSEACASMNSLFNLEYMCTVFFLFHDMQIFILIPKFSQILQYNLVSEFCNLLYYSLSSQARIRPISSVLFIFFTPIITSVSWYKGDVEVWGEIGETDKLKSHRSAVWYQWKWWAGGDLAFGTVVIRSLR